MTVYPTAQQASAVWVLTSPRGDRAVFNDDTDPDYVGALVGEDAVSGVDSPEVRNAIYDMVEADGALLGPMYHGMRPITLQASIVQPSVADRNAVETQLKRVLNGCTRADGALTWTPDGSVEQYLPVRKYQRLQIKGGVKKDALVSLVAGYPYIHSSTLHTSTFNHNTDTDIDNNGSDFGPAALIRINGPSSGAAVGPTIRRTYDSNPLELAFPGLSVASGTYIDIDPWNCTAYTSGGTNVFSYLDLDTSDWWTLGPETNTLRLEWDSGTTTGTSCRVDWRDAWL